MPGIRDCRAPRRFTEAAREVDDAASWETPGELRIIGMLNFGLTLAVSMCGSVELSCGGGAMSKTQLSRRQFMNRSLAVAGVGASFAIGGTKSSGRIIGANDTIRVAIAGLNGRGGSHVGEFAKMPGVEISYLVDPDTRTYAKRLAEILKQGGREPATVQDIRRAVDDKAVDAVSVATPNHWHALITIWACQAGKDVYVEKPCSHNVHEGASRFRPRGTTTGLSSTERRTVPRISGHWLLRRFTRASLASCVVLMVLLKEHGAPAVGAQPAIVARAPDDKPAAVSDHFSPLGQAPVYAGDSGAARRKLGRRREPPFRPTSRGACRPAPD